MLQEEQLLDELLDGGKAGSVDDTIKVFPDEARIDENKTSGRKHRILLKSVITRMKAWVKAELLGKSDTGHQHTISEVDNLQTTLNSHNQRITDNANALPGKADLVNGKVPAEQLPPFEGGTTVNSTDDIATEGAINKWWTEARTYLSKASNYVIQGTTRAITQNDTLGMILGIFENRLNSLATSITTLTNSLAGYVQKTDGYTAFSAITAYDRNKVMRLGGTGGDTFNANHVLDSATSGNQMNTVLTVIVTGNGANTVGVNTSGSTGWRNENNGIFQITAGAKNVFRLHYIDANNKFFTITQPK